MCIFWNHIMVYYVLMQVPHLQHHSWGKDESGFHNHESRNPHLPGFSKMPGDVPKYHGKNELLRYMRGDYAESMRSLFTTVRWVQAASCQSLEAYSGMTPAKLF